jgi:RHS repeat-associated protein
VARYDYDAHSAMSGYFGGGRRVRRSYDRDACPEAWLPSWAPTSGTVDVYYRYDGWRVVEEIDGDVTLRVEYTYGSYIDEPLTITTVGQEDVTHWYHQERGYNVGALSTGTGVIAELVTYDPDGEPRFVDGDNVERDPQVPENTYLFQGRRYDPETGLYYYRHRYYSPELGRFISRDPKPFQGARRYGLVGLDPIGLDVFVYQDGLHTEVAVQVRDPADPERVVGAVRVGYYSSDYLPPEDDEADEGEHPSSGALDTVTGAQGGFAVTVTSVDESGVPVRLGENGERHSEDYIGRLRGGADQDADVLGMIRKATGMTEEDVTSLVDSLVSAQDEGRYFRQYGQHRAQGEWAAYYLLWRNCNNWTLAVWREFVGGCSCSPRDWFAVTGDHVWRLLHPPKTRQPRRDEIIDSFARGQGPPAITQPR